MYKVHFYSDAIAYQFQPCPVRFQSFTEAESYVSGMRPHTTITKFGEKLWFIKSVQSWQAGAIVGYIAEVI